MMVSGTLLITDAVSTLVWQEPISALMALRNQTELEEAFAAPPPRVVERRPLPGDAIARIQIPAIGVSEYVVEGTSTEDLREGPGHYPETPLPGDPGTSAIAGHRTTYGAPFRRVDKLKAGQRLLLEMVRESYVYRVEKTAIVDDSDRSVLDPVGRPRLVLTACHPLYSAAQRIVVFARLVGMRPSRVSRSDASRDSRNRISPITSTREITSTTSQ